MSIKKSQAAWKTECEDKRVAGRPVQTRQDETLAQVFLTHLVGVFKPKLPKIHERCFIENS